MGVKIGHELLRKTREKLDWEFIGNFFSKYDEEFWKQSLKTKQSIFKEESEKHSGLKSDIFLILSKISNKSDYNVKSLKDFSKALLGACFDGNVDI